MSKKPDGGPAFPGTLPDEEYANGVISFRGMTLRDWFAGQALAGFLAAEPEWYAHDAACDAYRYADAMIAAREQ